MIPATPFYVHRTRLPSVEEVQWFERASRLLAIRKPRINRRGELDSIVLSNGDLMYRSNSQRLMVRPRATILSDDQELVAARRRVHDPDPASLKAWSGCQTLIARHSPSMSGDRCVALLIDYGELRINGLGELEVIERAAPAAPLPEIEIDVPDPEPERGAPREIVVPDAPPIPDHSGDPTPAPPEIPPEWARPQSAVKVRSREFPIAPTILKSHSKMRCANCRSGFAHDLFWNRGPIQPRSMKGGEVIDISHSSIQHSLLARQTELLAVHKSFIGSGSLDRLRVRPSGPAEPTPTVADPLKAWDIALARLDGHPEDRRREEPEAPRPWPTTADLESIPVGSSRPNWGDFEQPHRRVFSRFETATHPYGENFEQRLRRRPEVEEPRHRQRPGDHQHDPAVARVHDPLRGRSGLRERDPQPPRVR